MSNEVDSAAEGLLLAQGAHDNGSEWLRSIESVQGRLGKVEKQIAKFRKRMGQKDPITGDNRYG